MPPLAATRGFEVRDMVNLDRYSSPALSPDGRRLVFAKRVLDEASGTASTSLWIEDLFARDAAPPKRLTPEGWNVNSPAFSPDGTTVYFLSAKDDSSQLYSMPAAGGEPVKLTAFPVGVDGFKISPDGSRVAFSAGAFPDCKAGAGQGVLACTKAKLDEAEKSKATGMVFDRMFIRHWDTWSDGRMNRVFVADLPAAKATAVGDATLVGADVPGDVPSKPFGDSSEYAWAPDGKSLVLSARKSDRTEPWSTNFDLYQVSADGSGAARNLTEANKAWDTGPVFADDGKTLYYRAMARPGFEADRLPLMAMDLADGGHTYNADPETSVEGRRVLFRSRRTASRWCSARASPTARSHGPPTSTSTRSAPTAAARPGTSPRPTRPGTRARCSPTTARRCTTARWSARASRPTASRSWRWTWPAGTHVRSRRTGTARPAASCCPTTARPSTPPLRTWVSTRCSRSTSPAAKRRSWWATARSPRSRSPAQRRRSRATA